MAAGRSSGRSSGKGIERVVRLRYMKDFACLGSDCPYTCCGWWTIQIDQSHYAKLQKAMGKTPEDKQAFADGFRLTKPERRTREHFALMVLNDDGYCKFLDGNRWCGLHQRHGEELLPDACAIYPRAFSQLGKRLELTGEPSCPEVARRLLTDENAIQLEDAKQSDYGRVVPVQDMPEVVSDAYWGVIDKVRGTLYRLVERRDFSTGQKLYFALFFASQLDRFLRPRGEAGEFSEERLEHEIDFLDRPDVLSELGQRYLAEGPATPLPVSLLAETLARVAKDSVPLSFYRLIAGTLGTYEGPGRGMRRDETDGGFVLSPEPLWQHYSARRASLEPKVRERVELYFRNYLGHQVLHEWYTFSPSVFAYVQNVALRVALLRFLLYSHPQLEEAVGDDAKLDAIAIEVFYLLSRAMEHNKKLLDGASERLAELMPNLQTSTELLKL